jgi:hypothetical protein
MTSRNTLTPADVCGQEAPKKPLYSEAQLLRMWPQAAGELRGYASVLERGNAGMTAAQMRMAVQLGEQSWKRLTLGKKPCTKCRNNGSIHNPDYDDAVKNPGKYPAYPNSPPPYIDCPACEGKAWLDDPDSMARLAAAFLELAGATGKPIGWLVDVFADSNLLSVSAQELKEYLLAHHE